MEQFDAGGGADEGVKVGVVGAAGKEEEEWTQPLAARADEFEEQGGDDRKVGRGRLLDARFDAEELGPHRGGEIKGVEFHGPHLRLPFVAEARVRGRL